MVFTKPTFILFTVILCSSSLVRCIPVAEDGKSNPDQMKTKPVVQKDKFRQDGEGDGEDGISEIEEVGNQVSQIITGVLSGNIGQIFGGSTGFIDDDSTQTGVGTILASVTKPLNTILVSGVQSGQKYFNITGPPVILLHSTTAAPPPPVQQQPQQPISSSSLNGVAAGGNNYPGHSYYLEPIVIDPPKRVAVASPVTGSPVRRATTQKFTDDEDDDNDSDSKL